MEENDNENENENKEASQDQEILSIIRESRYKQRQSEEEENDCEQLIRLHQNVPGCSLMTEGFHSKKKKFYFCTCDPDCQNPLCINCVQKCHYDHWKKNNKILNDLQTDKRNALCHCGMKNHIVLENEGKTDFVYDEQCQFLEWSITTKNYAYYEDENNPDEVLCMFCYKCCKGEPSGYVRKSDELLCRRLKCCCMHEDYLNVFEKIGKLVSINPFSFEKFSGIQFLNMLLKSSKSFENSFHRVANTMNLLKEAVLGQKKKKFDFTIFINNSPFFKALEKLSNILDIIKLLYYPISFFDCSSFIFPLLQRKLKSKGQDNIWAFKRYVFDIYHKINFRKDFERLPILSVKDMINLNPFQREMYCDYIHLFPNLEEKYFKVNEEEKNYIDDILRTLDKFKNIRHKDENAYEILKKIYSECKKIVRFNKFSPEQCLKFYSLNDDIIFTALSNKEITLKNGFEQMRMLSQMVKCILYLSYYYNDSVLRKYLSGEISLSQVAFFHSNSETAKMIYKNCTHILLYCRTIHEICVVTKKASTEITSNTERMSKTLTYMTTAMLRSKIDKFQNKIMFMSTEITSLTLNSPDAYYFGLKRLKEKDKNIFCNYINNILTEKEVLIFDEMKEICNDLENIYQQYFSFEITADDVEQEVIERIEEFFRIIGRTDYKPSFGLFINGEKDLLKTRTSVLNTLINKKEKGEIDSNDISLRILINKTPLLFTLSKSLHIILRGNSSNQQHKKYFDNLFRFYGYYVYESTDNCLLFLNDRLLKASTLITTDNIGKFINLLYYISKILQKNNITLSQNNELMKVLENLVSKVSGKSEYVLLFERTLKIIYKLSKMNYLHQEHTMNKIRKTLKNIYYKNPIFKTFKDILIPRSNESNGEIINIKSLTELIEEGAEIDGYNVEVLTALFTRFLKIINYLFDGNSTLNEVDFLQDIFLKEQIPPILNDLTLFLTLRIELLKFYRITYVDVLIDTTKTKEYISIFANDSINNGVDSNFEYFIFFQDLLKVKDKVLDMNIDCDIFNAELKNFGTIVKNSGIIDQNIVVRYFEEGLVLPLQVFINKYISIIYNLDGYQYIKLYQIVLHFLETKKYIIEEGLKTEKQIETDLNVNIFSAFAKHKKNRFTVLLHKIQKDQLEELNEDINKLKDHNLEILNYKYIFSFFEKHVNAFINVEGLGNLQETFKKKANTYSIEEIEEKRDENRRNGSINSEFSEKIFEAILKYEMTKNNYMESSLIQNLAEKNVLFDTTYRTIMLRPMFYLINSETLYLKYRRQNLWHIFRLLQYDTTSTQEDIYKLRKADLDRLKKKKNLLINNNTINKIILENEGENQKKNEEVIKPTVNFPYLIDLFLQNLLSVIFERCNPSSVPNYEDYTIAYMVIKIMKYMCEDHNINFQTLFFQEITVETPTETLNIFDLMMCILNKILLLGKWEEVTFESNDSSIDYFYEIFFCLMEFSIEMIQGTSKENLQTIIDSFERKDEKSYFYRFLVAAKLVLKNNANDCDTLYKVRFDLINFVAAFIEERNTPQKIISLIENLYNPMNIFDSIVATLKKLYLREEGKDVKTYNEIEFNNEICELFMKKYFSDSEFSKNQEFELANRMYYYVKQLAIFNNKDAKNIIDSCKLHTTEQIIDLRQKRDNAQNDSLENSESVLIEARYFQNYFAVKFFESITRQVWIRGEEKQKMLVLFTLVPSVLYLSENSKTEFFDKVPRDSRSSKLFSLMEYTDYFSIEINQNKKKLTNNFLLKLINKLNFSYLDGMIYLLTSAINITIFSMAEYKDEENNYKKLISVILPMGLVQLSLTILSLIFWFVSKYKLYYVIEKEKYYISHRMSNDIPLTWGQYLDIVIMKTLLSKREIVNFTWDLVFSILGVLGPNFIFVYSIQLLIIVNISSTLQNITKAIAMRYQQLLTLFMFMIIAIYIFSTLAFFLFSKDYIHELQENHENTCGTLFYCFLTHMEFGLRTDGGIGEFINKISFEENPTYFMKMFFFQFIFYLLIIIIMLNVVGGSIIDTFAELREKSSEDLYDMKNVCFICNGTRNDIEKQGEIFDQHIENVHNIWTYIDYMIGLKFVDPQETNAINSFVIEQLEDKKISWFPLFAENDNSNEKEEEED